MKKRKHPVYQATPSDLFVASVVEGKHPRSAAIIAQALKEVQREIDDMTQTTPGTEPLRLEWDAEHRTVKMIVPLTRQYSPEILRVFHIQAIHACIYAIRKQGG